LSVADAETTAAPAADGGTPVEPGFDQSSEQEGVQSPVGADPTDHVAEPDPGSTSAPTDERLSRPRSPDQVPVTKTPARRSRTPTLRLRDAAGGLKGYVTPPRVPTVSRRVAIRLCLAAAIVVAAVLTNRTFLGWGLFVTFAVLLVPVGRTRSFIMSFVPYATVWFVFSALRSLADETILAQTLNTNVWRLERWLFGGQLPTILLQDRIFDRTHLGWHDYFFTAIHWSYFVVPHAVAIRIWYRNSTLFRQYLGALTLLLAVGLCIYFLIPSNPPWLAPDPVNSPAAVQVERVMEPVGKQLSGGLYTASYKVIGESNPIAAMPSIHMAITFLLVFAARRAGRGWQLLAMLYSGLMAFALVYLGEHYVVDVAVGMMITAYGWFAAGTWLRRVAPAIGAGFVRRSRPVGSAHGAGA
jgi:hypothetical protein